MFRIYDIIFPINSCIETAKEIDHRPAANLDDKISLKMLINQHDVVKGNPIYCDQCPQPEMKRLELNNEMRFKGYLAHQYKTSKFFENKFAIL